MLTLVRKPGTKIFLYETICLEVLSNDPPKSLISLDFGGENRLEMTIYPANQFIIRDVIVEVVKITPSKVIFRFDAEQHIPIRRDDFKKDLDNAQ